MLSDKELLNSKMSDAYRQLRHELFCEETGLIYDSICGGNHDLRFEHLPYVEEIQANVPNPHGYATGMEDSMLNAGFAIEMCICRAGAEPETKEECKDFARRLFRGMVCCATVHGHHGYVVRSVSPRDGHSCYMESSRDQFTLFVYGMWRYYHSDFSTLEEKSIVRSILADIADYAESKMNDSASYNLGRLDGFPGVHLQMLNTQSHEAMRLPMFFAAAYDVTRELRFLDLYQKYYPRAMIESERMRERTRPWWHIELSQMQFSLALCRNVDPDNKHMKHFDSLMTHIAELAETQTSEYHFTCMNDYHAPWNPPVHAWRNSRHFSVQLFEDGKVAMRGGKVYLKGEESPEFKVAFDRIRALGNMITAMLLASNYQPNRKFCEDFNNSASVPDYKGHPSGGLVNILCAYFMARMRKLLA
jgi:hypothetical protein